MMKPSAYNIIILKIVIRNRYDIRWTCELVNYKYNYIRYIREPDIISMTFQYYYFPSLLITF